jgi:hypothetical protein
VTVPRCVDARCRKFTRKLPGCVAVPALCAMKPRAASVAIALISQFLLQPVEIARTRRLALHVNSGGSARAASSRSTRSSSSDRPGAMAARCCRARLADASDNVYYVNLQGAGTLDALSSTRCFMTGRRPRRHVASHELHENLFRFFLKELQLWWLTGVHSAGDLWDVFILVAHLPWSD